MKKIHYQLFIILILLSATGCNSLVLKVMGFKKPQYETNENLKKYVNRKNLPEESVYRADSTLLLFFNSCFYIMPNALVFNNSNQLIDIGYPGIGNTGKDSVITCSPGFDVTMRMLCNGAQFPLVEKPKTEQFLKHMHDLNGKSAFETVKNDYDFLVIVGWAKYYGRFNNKAENWISDFKTINGCNIKVLRLNTDPQKEWGPNWSGLDQKLFYHLRNQ